VFVDANVLVSRTLRDWVCLLRVNTDGMFQLHTTEDVLSETINTLRNLFPEMPGGAMTQVRKSIIESVDELVPDFDTTVAYSGADPHDLHVHAAAIACRADILLSEDQGFVDSDETPYEVFTSDDFFILIDDSAPWLVQLTVHKMNQYWASKPSDSRKSLTKSLINAGCPNFAKRVERHLRTLSGPARR
jgi:hypothetical protein